jgi:hypothetical protein
MGLRPQIQDGTAARGVLWAAVIVATLLVLLAPALWNGFPLLQYDTGGYLARWYEGYLVPSRPGAYGLLLAAGSLLDFWGVLIVQAAAVVWIVALVLRAHGLGRRPLLLVGVVVCLSVLTTLPWITAILLTDVFAGVAVLALYLLVCCDDALSRGERWGLLGLAAFAGATHSATLAVIGGMACAAACGRYLFQEVISRAAVHRATFAAVLGVILTLAGNFAVSGKVAWSPGGYGIVFGRMLQDGIVTRYLEAHCPDPELKLCPYRHQLPRDADAFLWGRSVFNTLGRFDGLGKPMRHIVLGSVREYPGMQIRAALTAALTQLVSVRTGEGVVDRIWHTYGIMTRYTPNVLPALRAARQQHGGMNLQALNRLHVPVALLCMALLPILVTLAVRRKDTFRPGLLAATVAVALLLNAAVCGVLSNPHDRYGARLVWLAPFAICLAALSRYPMRTPPRMVRLLQLAVIRRKTMTPAEKPAAG